MSTIILTQASHLNTTVVGVLDRQASVHEACQLVRPIPYRYVTPAYRKKFDTYTSILHPDIPPSNQYSRCVGACLPKRRVKKPPIQKTKAVKNDALCRPYKPLTQTQIRLRLERQTLRDLRNRIGSPPRAATRVNFEELEKVHHDFLEEEPRADKTTQLNCPLLKVKEPEKSKRVGIDRSTQVSSADIGNWDDDITNLVEVIAGKITQQCLLELGHEEELHMLRVHYRRLEDSRELRKDHAAAVIEAESEHQRNLAIELAHRNQDKHTVEDLMDRIGAAVVGENLVHELLPAVLDDLQQYGVHISEIVEEINGAFTRALTEQVGRELRGPEQEILMRLIRDEVQSRYDVYTHCETNERQFEVFEPDDLQDDQDVEEEELPEEKKVKIDSNIEIITERTALEE